MVEVTAIHSLVPALLLLGTLLLLCVAALQAGESRLSSDPRATLVEQVLSNLPQTQCGQCGYAGCQPYAEAICAGAALNKCPPGGAPTIRALARLLDREPLPLDPLHGQQTPLAVAYIREDECIGCVKCIVACPVDAIIGAPGQMHTVIASECTGCDLCLEPCPVDCIEMRPLAAAQPAPQPQQIATECSRCGFCAEACPVQLLPQQLHLHAGAQHNAELMRFGLFDCIECGACSRVCPSNIALAESFSQAKTRIHAEHERAQRAQHARRRFDNRQQRLREAPPEDCASTVPASPHGAATPLNERQQQVEEAIARVRAKHQQARVATDPAVAPAIERARQQALARASAMRVNQLAASSQPDTPALLQRRIATTERKLHRAQQKLSHASSKGDASTAQQLEQAKARLERRLLETRKQLDQLRSENS